MLYDTVSSDNAYNAIARIINEFYHCDAMCDLNHHERKKGQFYYVWEIILYTGNNSAWLEPHKAKLLKYIHSTLGWGHVKDIMIRN
jgi:hypothetical protein